MERRAGSGVLKKKSSSGCLIIKEAGVEKNSEGGLGALGDRSRGEKRARLVASGSDSSSSSSDEDESLEFMRRKANEKRSKKGSNGYKRNELEISQRDRDNAGIDVSAEKKTAALDLFEFDEYDEFDEKKMRDEFFKDRTKRVWRNGENVKESCVSPDERRQGSCVDGSSSGMRNKGFSSEDDEADMPLSLLKKKCHETAAESMRLQGKNGVLKVMVRKKKKMDSPSQPKNLDADKNGSLLVGKESSAKKEREEVKLEKSNPTSIKDRKARDSGVHMTDTVKLATPKPQVYSSKKAVKKEEAQRSPSTENLPRVKGKESNAKRGGSTEKQVLRDKIREMLIDAGWSIDYRPRRNRDYLDAVYISPSGTAYWSITKAYDAFKRDLEEDDHEVKASNGPPSFAPLSEDLISKLTRQTKKKIAEEQKRKRKENGMTKSAKKSAVKEAEGSSDSDDYSSDDSLTRNQRRVKFEKHSTASKSNAIQERTSKIIGRCTLLIRGSDRGNNSDSDGYVPYRGKRTILAWLIDCGTAKLSEKVQYKNRRRTRDMLEGWITRDGIHCGCCSKILTVSKFEVHAGSKLRQPFQNIFLESGSSLLQCQIDAWNSQEPLHQDSFTVAMDGDDPDDDACGICGDGGDLICCDSCPSTFHQICLGIQMLPSGDWHCPNCTCKFCGLVSGKMAEENDIDCVELNRCNLCEKKYHKSCSERAHTQPTSSCSASFCGLKCQEIYDQLQKILGVKHDVDAGISWSLIRRANVSDISHREFPSRVECNSKLAVALSVMDECFLPIIDRRSGINIIHNVVYNIGSNFNRLNFHGFYTAILERGDEILAAASIRFHGDRLAEMPFIGTREIYRRQGMCSRLLSAIETELCSLKIERLVIPAVLEHINTWTTVFGFHELEDVHKKDIKFMNMVVFPGTDMLQKQLVMQENSDGIRVAVSNKKENRVSVVAEKPEVSLSGKQNQQASSDSGGCPTSKTCDEVDSIPSDALVDTNNPAPNTSDAAHESEMENNKRKSGDIPDEEESISDRSPETPPVENGVGESEMENKQKQPADKAPAGDDSNSDACKTEDSQNITLHSVGIDNNMPEMAPEDAAHSKTVSSNGCMESSAGLVSGSAEVEKDSNQ